MGRRRIAAQNKKRPSDLRVNEIMQKGRELIRTHQLTNAQINNFDETGITYTSMPTHMYVPKEQQRASGHGSDKSRVTAIIMANAEGDFAPLAIIMRC